MSSTKFSLYEIPKSIGHIKLNLINKKEYFGKSALESVFPLLLIGVN